MPRASSSCWNSVCRSSVRYWDDQARSFASSRDDGMRFEIAFERHDRVQLQIQRLKICPLGVLFGLRRFRGARPDQRQLAFQAQLLGQRPSFGGRRETALSSEDR